MTMTAEQSRQTGGYYAQAVDRARRVRGLGADGRIPALATPQGARAQHWRLPTRSLSQMKLLRQTLVAHRRRDARRTPAGLW